MDSNRLSYWTDSISDIIKKTELNLLQLHKKTPPPVAWEEYSRPTTAMTIQNIPLDRSIDHRIQSYRAGSFQHQETEPDTGLFIAKELDCLKLNLEKLLQNRHSTYSNEMNEVLSRLASIELNMSSRKENVTYTQGHNFKQVIKVTETKFQSELNRLQDQLVGIATREDLKKVQDYMRTYSTDDINRIELQCRNVHSSVDTLKHEMYNFIEEKLRSVEYNGIKQSQLYNFKSEVSNETERKMNKIKDSFETNLKILGNELHDMVENKVYSCEKTLVESVNNQTKDYKHIIKKLETQLNDSTHSFNNLENERDSFKQDLTNIVTEICDCRQNLADLRAEMIDYKKNLGNLEKEMKKFKQNLDDVPSLKDEMGQCKEELGNLEGQMDNFKKGVGNLEKGINEYKQSLELVRKNFDYTQDDTKRELQEIKEEMHQWDKRLNTSSMEKQIQDIRKELQSYTSSKDLSSKLQDLQDRISKSVQLQDLQNLTKEIHQIQLYNSQQEDRLASYEERLFRLEADQSVEDMHQGFYASSSIPIDTNTIAKPLDSEFSSKDSINKIQIVDKLDISQESGMSQGENLEVESGICFESGFKGKEDKPDSFRNMRYKDIDIEPTLDAPHQLNHFKPGEQKDMINLKSKLGPLIDFSKKEGRVMKEQSHHQDTKPQFEQPVSLVKKPEIQKESVLKIQLQPKESLKVNHQNPDFAFSDLLSESQDNSLEYDHSSSVMNSILEDESDHEDPFNKVSNFPNKIQNLIPNKLKEPFNHKPNISIPSLDDYTDLIESSRIPQQRNQKLSQDSQFSQFSKPSIEFMLSSRSKSKIPQDQDEEFENLADYLTEALLSEELGLGLDVIEDVAYRYIEQHNPELIEEGGEMYEYEDEISEEGSDISDDY